MYAKCGSLNDAYTKFVQMPRHSVVSWGAMITGYAQNEQGELALELYDQMEREGVKPNQIILPCLLKACGDTNHIDLAKGHSIYMKIIQTGHEKNLLVGNTLVGLYAKHGAFQEAEYTFHQLVDQNVVSWNALITGYGEHGSARQALACFKQMKLQKISPDLMTYASILKSCGSSGAIGNGQEIHAEIIKRGLERCSISVGNSLITMYV